MGANGESDRIVEFLLGDQVQNPTDSSPFCKIHLHKMIQPLKFGHMQFLKYQGAYSNIFASEMPYFNVSQEKCETPLDPRAAPVELGEAPVEPGAFPMEPGVVESAWP